MNFVTGFITSLINGGIAPKNTSQITEARVWKRLASATDKGWKRSISYKLIVEYDHAHGYAKDHKTGFEVKYSSLSKDQSLTKGDIARIKAQMKIKKAQEDAETAKRHSIIAARAKIKWAAAKSSGTHPYLNRKKVALGSARILGDLLFISIHEPDGELVSWQTINAQGEKRFPFGGKKQGCWHTIGTINPIKHIYVCEGWATGASIAAALDCAVVVAFDAGNLMPVVKSLRSMYSNAPIVVAADNDASQTGQKAAAACAKAVKNCSFKIPETVNSDFNDLDANAIRSILCPPASSPDGISPVTGTDVQAIGGDWRDLLIRDAKGAMVSSSLKNAILHIQYHESMQGVFGYDEFKRDILMLKCPPWMNESEFKVCTVSDLHFNQCAAYMEDHGLVMTKDKTASAIEVAAHENKFHSARQFFKGLKWDGVARLPTMFLDHFGCKSESSDYLAWVATKWMTAAVARIMEPGCKFDHVLVLESMKQGLGKSTALKKLVTFGQMSESYYTDTVSVDDIGGQYTALKMQGVMIIELAELKGFSKQDDNSIKSWLTNTHDELKLPFDRRTTKYPRQFVFAATLNGHEYLKDPTGNRRYWPVTVEKVVDMEALGEAREQLWAEAAHNYNQGLYIGPTEAENDQADEERQKRLSHDAWTDIVMKIVANIGLDEFKLSHIVEKMDLKLHDKNDRAQNRIKGILQMNGYENKPVWNTKTKKPERMWSLK